MERKGTLPPFVFSEELTREVEPVAMSAGGHLAAEDNASSGPAGRTLAPQGCLVPFQKLLLLNSWSRRQHWRVITKQRQTALLSKVRVFISSRVEVLCKIPKRHRNSMSFQNPSHCGSNNVVINIKRKLNFFNRK